jgi:propanol-preferring alcohol dehydrogenase
MKAVRIRPKELEIQELETPQPKDSEVLVKVQSSGVCHSDIQLWDGGYRGPEGQFLKVTDRGIKYPLTPGHEVAGLIDSFGEDAKGFFTKSEKVIIYPWIGEGLCPACRGGEDNLCDGPRSLGVYRDGGYAEYLLVPNYRYIVKLDEDMDIDATATLSCSGLTAYRAIKNANLKPDDKVVIVGGTGGLGLMAIQLAKALTGAKVIVIGLYDNKLQVARKYGADAVVNSNNEDPTKTIMDLTYGLGADAVIDFVNDSKTVEADLKFLRRTARLVLVGLFGGVPNF